MKPVRRLFVLGMLMALCACGGRIEAQKDVRAADADPSRGTVIFGMTVLNNEPNNFGSMAAVTGIWMPYDPQSGRRIGKTVVALDTGSGMFMAPELKAGGTAYRFYELPPGNYALAWMRHTQPSYEDIQVITVKGKVRTSYMKMIYDGAETELGQSLSEDAQVLPSTPCFTVGPNEVVYVGNLVFDVGLPRTIDLSLQEDAQSARDYLARSNPDLDAKIIVRPITRADGQAFGLNGAVQPSSQSDN